MLQFNQLLHCFPSRNISGYNRCIARGHRIHNRAAIKHPCADMGIMVITDLGLHMINDTIELNVVIVTPY